MIARVVMSAMAVAASVVLIVMPIQAGSVLAEGGSCTYHCAAVKGLPPCC